MTTPACCILAGFGIVGESFATMLAGMTGA
jgi:hypothetical protein